MRLYRPKRDQKDQNCQKTAYHRKRPHLLHGRQDDAFLPHIKRSVARAVKRAPPCPFASAQSIPRAAHSAQRIVSAMLAQRLAQAPDVDIHGAGIDIDVAPPDPVQQLFA